MISNNKNPRYLPKLTTIPMFIAALAILSAANSETIVTAAFSTSKGISFNPNSSRSNRWNNARKYVQQRHNSQNHLYSSSDNSEQVQGPEISKAPTFNGSVIFPLRAMLAGLKGHKVAAVYAIMNNQYKRGSGEGWEHCEYIGFTRDLDQALTSHQQTHGAETVSQIRALSFAFPQKSAMEEVVSRWTQTALEAGGKVAVDGWDVVATSEVESDDDAAKRYREEMVEIMRRTAYYDDDDEDDDEFEDDEDEDYSLFIDKTAELGVKGAADEKKGDSVISPFSEESSAKSSDSTKTNEPLVFNKESVDKILDEVRPYLISDGGNVSVQRVDEDTKNVYLVLEGACGSCASSTVTMQMGIERVLKENFADLGEVIQVEEEESETGKPTELTFEAVEAEVNRIGPAISAMGGIVEIVNVDPIGEVELRFRGSNKLQQGLELAIRDVPFVKHVKFTN